MNIFTLIRVFKREYCNLLKTTLLSGVLLLTTGLLHAQSPGKVAGIVVTQQGEPIIGANVLEKGSATNGATTDIDGKFVIDVKPGQSLVVSYLGYITQEVAADTKKPMRILLTEDAENLEEVVVIAYGTQKKVTVTGAVSSVQTKDLKQSPAPNLISTLTGRLPGLTTIQNSGRPGEENFSMYLRGASTTNGQQPLVLVDGVPRDNITSLDPNEIASVSVLKDASSTAVFGVRGANGVILVTTKQGANEKPSLSISAEFGLQDNTRDINLVDSWDHAILRNQARRNSGLGDEYSPRQIRLFRDGTNPLYPNTDWYDIIFKSHAPMSRYNVNLSGGTDRVKYFVNAGIMDQGGMFRTEPKSKLGYDPQYKLTRYNFRTNLNIKINDWIKSTVNLAGYIDQQNSAGGVTKEYRGNPLHILVGVYQLSSAVPGPVTTAGMGVPVDELTSNSILSWNPYGILNRHGYERADKSSLNSTVALDFDLKSITKGLTTKLMVSFDTRAAALTSAIKAANLYGFSVREQLDENNQPYDDYSFNPKEEPQFYPLTTSKATNFQYTLNMQWAVNYERTFNRVHRVTGMALLQRDNSEAKGGISDALLPYNMLGLSGRVTYGYDNRYLVEFNVGYNGSEQFHRDQRFGFFPAGSIGWVISNEKFMKKQKAITNLKLRASYGKVGNDKLGDTRFLYLDNVALSSGGFSPSLGENQVVNENLIGNRHITWEVASKQNYGLELGLFNCISFNADIYKERREQILITRGTVPTMLGLPLANVPKANLGKVDNWGYEMELGFTKAINKDLSVQVKGNFNYNKNTVRFLDEALRDESYAYRYRRTGFSLSQDFGLQIDWDSPGHGYFTSQEEIDKYYPYEGVTPRPGDFVYKDINEDGVIDSKDEVPIKYGNLPRITYGANFYVGYKGFDISVLFQGVAQTSQYYSSWGVFESQSADGVYFPHHRNAWTKERYESGAKIDYPALSTTQSSSMRANDFFIMNRSYLRLKNAEIGYTLPAKLTKKIGIDKIRVYINGQNLLVWDKLPFDHFDPEQSGATAIPIQRVINFGANIVF